MIEKLGTKDQKEVLEYLYKEAAFNIFIIGDIETYGMETEFQRIYGERDQHGKLISLFLRFRVNSVYYADQTRFNLEYLKIFKKDPFQFLSGKAELMDLIKPHLPLYESKPMYFCKASEIKLETNHEMEIKTLKTEEDASKLFDLLVIISEFNFQRKEKEEFVKDKSSDQKMGMTLFIEENGLIVSTVATTAETTKNAMVIAVATHKDYRNKGYASILMQKLMDIYLNGKNKELCLFYNNPDAGKIYHRLGFETIGMWNVLNK